MKNKISISEFYCTQCGNRGIPIPRRKGAEREAGHLKKLFCIYCNKENNAVECKAGTKYTFDQFKIEYEYGNFNEEGLRKYTYKELKRLIENGRKKEKTLVDLRDTRNREEYLDSES